MGAGWARLRAGKLASCAACRLSSAQHGGAIVRVGDWEWLLIGPLPVGPALLGGLALAGLGVALLARRWLRADDARWFASERAALQLGLQQTQDGRAILQTRVKELDGILAALPVGVAVFDAAETLLAWNPRFGELADIVPERLRVGAGLGELLRDACRPLADGGQVEMHRAAFAEGGVLVMLVAITPRLAAHAVPESSIVPTPALAEPAPQDGVPAPAWHRARRMLVLLVEDILVNQMVTATALRRDGHRVDVAASGAEAVLMASDTPYELVLMDLMMPGMSGYDAARAIRALPGVASVVPIVALTATASDQDRISCRAAGMQGMLTKPVPLAALEDLLAECLRPIRYERPVGAVRRDARLLDVVRLAELQRGLPEGLFIELVDEALGEMGARIGGLHAALQAGLATDAIASSHALAGIAGSYGLMEFERQMRRVMIAARTGDAAAAAAAGDGMVANLDRSASALRAMLRP
jgi:CheY-like chemotaxis protein